MIECDPTASRDVCNVAIAEPFSVPALSVIVPSMKLTVPVGVPDVVLVTVAVNVTDCANVDGLLFDVTAVVVAAGVMVPEMT